MLPKPRTRPIPAIFNHILKFIFEQKKETIPMETLENRTLTGVDAIALAGNKLGEAMREFMVRMGLPVADKAAEGQPCGRVKMCLASTGRDAAWFHKPHVSFENVPDEKKASAEELCKHILNDIERMVRKSEHGSHRLVSVQLECVCIDGRMFAHPPGMKDLHILIGRTFGDGYRFMDDRAKLMKWLNDCDMKPYSRKVAA